MSSTIETWFASRGWKPLAFQQEAWDAYYEGESGLISVPTGSGKTYAATLAAIAEGLPKSKLSILYLTPLRALARDIALSLQNACDALAPGHQVEIRTGDTSSYRKTKQLKKTPSVMVTTPESLAVLLCQKNAREILGNLKLVVTDEWHELLGSKRGCFTELLLARLRVLCPKLRTWALSATIGNLNDALHAALGADQPGKMIHSETKRPVDIEVVVPRGGEWIPWGGHLGLYCLEEVLEKLDPAESTILFTNTRNQAERWYQALSIIKDDWAGTLALHHGSLHAKERERVEAGVKEGSIRIVVATSSLDLGVDFPSVDRVFQIGSPKNIARMVQRAGRTRHRPGERSQLFFVPSQLLECAEIEAVRKAISEGQVESKLMLDRPFDVLAQHLVTLACEMGFTAEEAYAEVSSAASYRNLGPKEFAWVLEFLERGGEALKGYPEYQKIKMAEDGLYRISSPRVGRLHKMNLGTIQENADLEVRFLRGGRIGRMEENYISRLKIGDKFFFAGKALELVRLDEKGALVRRAKTAPDQMPKWMGGRMPLSEALCAELRPLLASYGREAPYGLSRLLNSQAERSAVPTDSQVLLETWKSKDGHHLYVYPFEGRIVHEALAALFAYRLVKEDKNTFSLSVNEYGFELLSAKPIDFAQTFTKKILDPYGVDEDILKSLNHTELEKRQFREIARIGGLLYSRYPGKRKTIRQLQSSASLLFDVIRDIDPGNLLLAQARREVLDLQFEITRLEHALDRMRGSQFLWKHLDKPSPFSVALMLERLSTRISNESLKDRVERMRKQWLA